jgi:hypothetical protein
MIQCTPSELTAYPRGTRKTSWETLLYNNFILDKVITGLKEELQYVHDNSPVHSSVTRRYSPQTCPDFDLST